MKRLIKSVGTEVLFRTGALARVSFNTRILAFHQANPSFFESQMEYLKKNYPVVALCEAVEDLDRKQVVITFDDGYRNNLTVAYPVLKRLGLRATVFVTTHFIDKDPFTWWDRIEHSRVKTDIDFFKEMPHDEIERQVVELTGIKADAPKPDKYRFLSWKELKGMSDVFDVGSHTVTHPILTMIPVEQARKEMADSRKIIEKKIGKVTSIAYPNGNFNETIAMLAKDCGYGCAVTYTKGNNTRGTDRHMLLRRGINYNDDVSIFANKIAGVF